MTDMPTYWNLVVNPLKMVSLDETPPFDTAEKPRQPDEISRRLLEDMIGEANVVEVLRARYRRATDECFEWPIVPNEPTIIGQVIRPLLEAKRCFVFRMPVACIAQAGLVGEMIALWRFRMVLSNTDLPPSESEIEKFDKLMQSERVKKLKILDSLEDGVVKTFDDLRSIRNKYLHYMVQPSQDVDSDACQALKLANTLVVDALGMSFDNGNIVLSKKVARFIGISQEYTNLKVSR